MTNFIKGVAKKLGKWGIGAVGAIVISLALWGISSLLPSEQPVQPTITSSPSPNPIVNTDSSASVEITVTPDFKPPYINDIEITIQNDNPHKCYMVLEFETSDGFKFLPISDNLPENFIIEEGYQYQNVMKVYIKDFPPKFDYDLKLSVYTMNPDTFGGTEKINWKVLEIHYESQK